MTETVERFLTRAEEQLLLQVWRLVRAGMVDKVRAHAAAKAANLAFIFHSARWSRG